MINIDLHFTPQPGNGAPPKRHGNPAALGKPKFDKIYPERPERDYWAILKDPALRELFDLNAAYLNALPEDQRAKEILRIMNAATRALVACDPRFRLVCKKVSPPKRWKLICKHVPVGPEHLMPDLIREAMLRILNVPSWWALFSECMKFQQRAYFRSLDFWRIDEEWLEQRKIEKYNEEREKEVARLQDQEMRVDALPEQKSTLLRLGLQSRNITGRLDDFQNQIRNYLQYNDADLVAAERFFKRNPAWTPGHILDLMEHCAALESFGASGHDPRWHARRGTNLRMILCNLDEILQGLGRTDFPAVEQASKEFLYRRPRVDPRATPQPAAPARARCERIALTVDHRAIDDLPAISVTNQHRGTR